MMGHSFILLSLRLGQHLPAAVRIIRCDRWGFKKQIGGKPGLRTWGQLRPQQVLRSSPHAERHFWHPSWCTSQPCKAASERTSQIESIFGSNRLHLFLVINAFNLGDGGSPLPTNSFHLEDRYSMDGSHEATPSCVDSLLPALKTWLLALYRLDE